MLTVKQPPTYGYKSVHDLPTPPSTSRPSPPLIYQDYPSTSLPVNCTSRSHSPSNHQPMSAPHRGLPPPAAMTLPPQHSPATGAPPAAHHAPPPPPPPPSLSQSHQQREPWVQLPAPPPQWQGAEESMRNWLQARAEEDRRKQEEEKTRQESLRLEQRRIEMEMLRASLSGGIPPPMVPLVFAGMGGGVLPQAALEWAQQFMHPPQGQHPQLLPPQAPVSPERQREAQPQAHGHFQNLPPAPTLYNAYPGSPTRPRGQTVTGSMGRPMAAPTNLPSLNTNVPPPPPPGHGHGHGQGPAPAPAPAPMMSHQHQQHVHQTQSSQHDSQPSPSIYFHHWQPPSAQASGSSSSHRPGTPSRETPKKRKATGHHHATPAPTPSDSRCRTPPFFPNNLSNPSSREQRGHVRQTSDLSSYRSSDSGRDRRDSYGGSHRDVSPSDPTTPGQLQSRFKTHRDRQDSQKHSLSSVLSEGPRLTTQETLSKPDDEDGAKRLQTSRPTDVRAASGAG